MLLTKNIKKFILTLIYCTVNRPTSWSVIILAIHLF